MAGGYGASVDLASCGCEAEAMTEYDPEKRLHAALARSGTAYAVETVQRMLAAEPDLTGAEILERLRSDDVAAQAELARWDALKHD